MKIRTIIAGLQIFFSASLYADWALSGNVLTDPDTGWAFNVNKSFSYNDGKETFTGMAITSTKTAGTGVVDFRNKALPEGVTLIAIGTGAGINSCTEMHIPDTIVYIGDNAFSTRALTKIYPCFPNSVRYIGKMAFYRPGSSKFTGDGDGNVRIGCGGNPFKWGGIAAFNQGKFVDLTLGPGVTNLPNEVFLDCVKLQKVTFLGEGLTRIESRAFDGCTVLEEISPELPSTVTYMGTLVFNNCQRLGSIRIGGSKPFTFSGESTAESRWFFRTYALTNVTIGSGVTLPSGGKLLECDGITDRTDTVKTIVFEGWPGDLSKLSNASAANYRRHFTVPEEYQKWMDYLNANGYIPWEEVSEEAKSAFYTRFGEEAVPPSGTFTFSGKTQFVTIKKVDTTASKRLLVETEMDGVFSQSDIIPEIGNHTLPSGSVACSASYAVDSKGTTKYKCDGYEFYEFVDNEWNLVSSSTDKSYTFNPEKNGCFKLRWKMSPAGYKVAITYPESLGSVEISGEEKDGDFFVAGSSFTVKATATTDAPFVRWFGNVAENEVSNATITVVADVPKTVIPYFKDKWVYDGTYISDGYWKLLTEGSKEALKLKKISDSKICVYSTLGTRELDLAKKVEGGKIVAVGFKAFRYSSNVDTIFLPKDCKSIEGQAFEWSSVKDIWFEGYTTALNNSFSAVALKVRLHVPKGDAEWNTLISERLVQWESCTANEKKAYWDRFDLTQTSTPPIGKATLVDGGQALWVMKWSPYKRGLSVIVR